MGKGWPRPYYRLIPHMSLIKKHKRERERQTRGVDSLRVTLGVQLLLGIRQLFLASYTPDKKNIQINSKIQKRTRGGLLENKKTHPGREGVVQTCGGRRIFPFSTL